MGMVSHAWDGTYRLRRALSPFVPDTAQAARTKQGREGFNTFLSFYLSFRNSTFLTNTCSVTLTLPWESILSQDEQEDTEMQGAL